MLYPRRNTAIGFIPAKFIGGQPTFFDGAVIQRRGVFTTFRKTTSIPDGYGPGGAFVLPYVGGGMSSWQATFGLAGSGDVLSGGPMVGSGAISFAGGGGLSLTVSLTGNGALSVTGAGGLALTIALAGAGALSITGAGGLSMIVPIAGGGAFGIAGAGDLKGNLSMAGSWGGAEPLSPEGVAAAVWAWAEAVPPGSKGDELAKALRAAKLAAALSA